MLTSGDQLLAHAIGDYILQSHWMATEKTKQTLPALIHASLYGLPFMLLRPSVWALVVIVVTHFIIDRWRLAKYVVMLKNLIGDPKFYLAKEGEGPFISDSTGYPPDAPPWLAVWLLIIADNIMHVVINGLAIRYL